MIEPAEEKEYPDAAPALPGKMMDKYSKFAELENNEEEHEDYTVLYRELHSKIAIMTPHGGGIKPGTVDIADALAGGDYTFYVPARV
jgi:phage replication-related protein YjqB (UPF0714/DUF867 family)